MNVNKLNDQLINGLVHDLMFAKKYFHLFKQIEKHWDKIKFLNEVDRKWILLLKDTSVQQTVLHLSKIYDSSGEQYNRNTRCLRDLLKNLTTDKIDDAREIVSVVSPISKLWDQFCDKHKIGLKSIGDVDTTNFIEKVQSYLNTQFSKDENIKNKVLINLSIIRNTNIAHNENYLNEIKLSTDQVEQLIAVAEVVLDYTNTFISTRVIGVYKDDSYVITQQIERIFEKVS